MSMIESLITDINFWIGVAVGSIVTNATQDIIKKPIKDFVEKHLPK